MITGFPRTSREEIRNDRLSKLLLAIHKQPQGSTEHGDLLQKLRRHLEEYAAERGYKRLTEEEMGSKPLDPEEKQYKELDIDGIIESVKYSDNLSPDEIRRRVIDMLTSIRTLVPHFLDSEAGQVWLSDGIVLDADLASISKQRNEEDYNYVKELELFKKALKKWASEYLSSEENGYFDVDVINEFVNTHREIEVGELSDFVLDGENSPLSFLPHESSKSPATSPNARNGGPENSLSVFRDMGNLKAGDMKLEFTPNNRLIFTAIAAGVGGIDVTKKVHCRDFGLLHINTNKAGRLNVLGETLLDIAQGKRIPKSSKYRRRISDIRGLFKKHLDIKDDPFQTDWTPHFTLIDRRSKADDRAKANAIHVPFNDNIHSVDDQPSPQDSNHPYDDEFDEAGEYLRGIDGNVNNV